MYKRPACECCDVDIEPGMKLCPECEEQLHESNIALAQDAVLGEFSDLLALSNAELKVRQYLESNFKWMSRTEIRDVVQRVLN